MVIVCVAVAVFPHGSVNVHVLVITAGHVPTGALSVPVTVPAASQLSVYAKRNGAGTSPIHSTVTSAGGVANTGAVCIIYGNSCVAVAVFPHDP